MEDNLRVIADTGIVKLFVQAADEWGDLGITFAAMEECGEFIQAAAKYSTGKPQPDNQLIEEAADVIITVACLIMNVHSLEELNGWIIKKMAKLNRKLNEPIDDIKPLEHK